MALVVVTSGLDYSNLLSAGLPSYLIQKLQPVHNVEAFMLKSSVCGCMCHLGSANRILDPVEVYGSDF